MIIIIIKIIVNIYRIVIVIVIVFSIWNGFYLIFKIF